VELKGRETEGVDIQTKPLHKKDPAVGTKQLVYSSTLIMEQEDAASFGDNEEVSLVEVFRISVPR
jgi:glutamyl-tRNA synthetase